MKVEIPLSTNLYMDFLSTPLQVDMRVGSLVIGLDVAYLISRPDMRRCAPKR